MDVFNDIGLLDRKKVLEIFNYLNERLKENHLQLEITIYGGTKRTIKMHPKKNKEMVKLFLQGHAPVVVGGNTKSVVGEVIGKNRAKDSSIELDT